MKFTQYFLSTRLRDDRKDIALTWIESVVNHPEHEIVQADGRIRRWGKVAQAEGRFLRVVLLPDGQTVHNAFFDRGFRS